MAAQAQKHVTHNEAIRALDALVLLSAIDGALTEPPASPAEGDRYLVPAGATGAWSARAGELAAFQDGAWTFYTPKVGWVAWVVVAEALHVFDGEAWEAITSAVSVNPAPLVGVNTIADAANRLAIASPASLFNHDGHGHRQTINKSAAGETASTIYQTDFSGRAEIGLAGDDDFHFKVSPDGETWKEALILERTTGTPRIPAFATASLPSAAVAGAGAVIFIPDAEDGPSLAISDGIAWRLVSGSALHVAAPEFTPAGGAYPTSQSVALSCATAGADIHFTIDGSDPTGSSFLYSEPIAISETTNIKAIAVKSGYQDSTIASATYTIGAWHAVYELASGNPDLILDFIGDQYRSGGADVALSSLITNAGTLSGSGMLLTATNMTATGALLTAIQNANCTIVAELFGGSAGALAGIISTNSLDAPLFKLGDNKLRGYVDAVAHIDTANTATWPSTINFCGTAFSAAGRSLAMNLGSVVGDSTAYPSRSSVTIGSFSGSFAFGGHLRRLLVWTRRLSDADLKSVLWPAPYLAPASGSNALKFRTGEKLVIGSSGSTALKFERTHAWSMFCAVNKRIKPGTAGAAVIFSNVTNGDPFTGYEVFVTDAGCLNVRIISSVSGNNWLGVVGSIDVADGELHAIAVTYDGSSTPGGIKLYVDGVLDPSPTTEHNTLSSSIAGASDFWVGNQVGVTSDYFFNGLIDQLTMHDVARDATYVASHATPATLPTTGSNIVLSLPMDAGSGTTAADASGNGYDGTIDAAGQWVR